MPAPHFSRKGADKREKGMGEKPIKKLRNLERKIRKIFLTTGRK